MKAKERAEYVERIRRSFFPGTTEQAPEIVAEVYKRGQENPCAENSVSGERIDKLVEDIEAAMIVTEIEHNIDSTMLDPVKTRELLVEFCEELSAISRVAGQMCAEEAVKIMRPALVEEIRREVLNEIRDFLG